MYTRIPIRAACLGLAARRTLPNRHGVLAVTVRTSSTDPPKFDPINDWKRLNEMYYGKERDMVNFPPLRVNEHHPPTRFGFIPETWFQTLTDKTGVTGPYLLVGTVATTLLSKELWVVDHTLLEFVAFWGSFYILAKYAGPALSKWLDGNLEEYVQSRVHTPLAEAREKGHIINEAMEKVIWREEGQKYLFEAKRENVGLQLEEEYRKRLATTYQAVKRRLDYHLELENTKRKFEQENMVKWIVDSVKKGITPQQEKDSIVKCISDLKVLAKAV